MLRAFKVHVERGQFDDADAAGDAVFTHFFDGGLRRLFFEFDFVALQFDFVYAFGAVGGVNHETHQRAFFAADEVNHFVQPPAGNVHKLAVVALGNGDDFVFDVQLAAFVGGATGDEFADADLFVFEREDGADAFQRKTHVDVEIFVAARREVVAMRVKAAAEDVHIDVEDVVHADLVQTAQRPGVAAAQQFQRFFFALAGDAQADELVFDAFFLLGFCRFDSRRPRLVFFRLEVGVGDGFFAV